jgi:hypothetical protein
MLVDAKMFYSGQILLMMCANEANALAMSTQPLFDCGLQAVLASNGKLFLENSYPPRQSFLESHSPLMDCTIEAGKTRMEECRAYCVCREKSNRWLRIRGPVRHKQEELNNCYSRLILGLIDR